MAVVTLCHDFGAQEKKVCHSFPSKEQASFNFMAVVTVCGDFGAPQNEIASLKVYNLKVHIWRLTVWSLQMMGKVTNAMRLVLMELGFKEVCL